MKAKDNKSERRRQEIVSAVVQHLLRNGFGNSGIRALAASVGISDRMLMYYFETKEELISAALQMIMGNLQASLEQIVPQRNASGAQIVNTLVAAGDADDIRPIMQLWFEIVGLAMRDEEPYKTTARNIVLAWEQWMAQKLRKDQRHRAGEFMAQLEGRLMLNLLTRGS